MKINVLGGGPSGLYFAYLARKRLGQVDIHVHERNSPDATFGFGVVLAGAGLARLAKADAESFARLRGITKRLGHQEIILNGEAVSIEGDEYGGAVERLQLLKVLQELCAEAGVRVSHHDEIRDVGALEDADLLIGADGANSLLRRSYAHAFGTHTSQLSNAFAWYGAERVHDRPTLSFRNAGGGAFCAHYYPYTDRSCTFVMECDRAAWEGCGFGAMSEAQRQAFVEDLFADELQGAERFSEQQACQRDRPDGLDRADKRRAPRTDPVGAGVERLDRDECRDDAHADDADRDLRQRPPEDRERDPPPVGAQRDPDSDLPRSFFDFFFQTFAQVTNPPLDHLRERLVTDLRTYLGGRPNVFAPKELVPLKPGIEKSERMMSHGFSSAARIASAVCTRSCSTAKPARTSSRALTGGRSCAAVTPR